MELSRDIKNTNSSPKCFIRIYWRTLLAIGLPIVLLPLPLIGQTKTACGAYTLLLMAVFWMTEAIPIVITSFIPCVLYPLFGIADTDTITREYLKDSIMLFVGGLLVALAFERSNVHKRIALRVMICTGTSIRMLMLGVMLTTMFLSMWMSNTATTAMMIPIISSVVDELEGSLDDAKNEKRNLPDEDNSFQPTNHKKKKTTHEKQVEDLRTVFLLSTCYSANIGGTGVITGSGTNLIALEYLGNLDPHHHGDHAALTFASWSAFNMVPMFSNIFISWMYLQLLFIGIPNRFKFWLKKSIRETSNALFSPEVESQIEIMLRKKYTMLGPITAHELGVLVIFCGAVLCWIFHDPKIIPGWSTLFHGGPKVSISTATLFFATLFFVVPRNESFYKALRRLDFENMKMNETLMEWDYVQRKFPWGVILLLSGGYALSKGAKASGLSAAIGESLKSLAFLPPPAIQLICMTLISFLTEVTSNTATCSIVVPILLQLSQELNIHPLYLALPATITCSYAFILPVATPPNSIVYSTGKVKLREMIRAGFFMNLVCVFVLFVAINIYGNVLFDFSGYNYVP